MSAMAHNGNCSEIITNLNGFYRYLLCCILLTVILSNINLLDKKIIAYKKQLSKVNNILLVIFITALVFEYLAMERVSAMCISGYECILKIHLHGIKLSLILFLIIIVNNIRIAIKYAHIQDK